MKQLQLIEESYTCLDKPLLEYVYEVDNYFLPDYQDLSSVLEIFVNRYTEKTYPLKKDTREQKICSSLGASLDWATLTSKP